MSAIRHKRYLLLPLLYLAVGGTVTAMLVQRVLHYATTVWLVLLLPMVMLTVLLTVAGLVNVWLSYRTWNDGGVLLRQYSHRSLLWLYLRCWAAVMAGLLLGVVFAWVRQMLPDYVQTLCDDLSVWFYVACVFLTLSALMSIVLGENLQEIRLRNAQSENQLLKAQLNPHFLYNTLNAVDALIWIDQERASQAVNSLSSLMRYMTYSARQESVPLADEVSAIKQLCDLQRLRLPNPEVIRLDLALPHEGMSVAPLLFMPLVENCFKHSGPATTEGAISIVLQVADGELRFSTLNPLPEASSASQPSRRGSKQGGVGLSVLRRRLELLYPGRYTLQAGAAEGCFRTMLTIADWPDR